MRTICIWIRQDDSSRAAAFGRIQANVIFGNIMMHWRKIGNKGEKFKVGPLEVIQLIFREIKAGPRDIWLRTVLVA